MTQDVVELWPVELEPIDSLIEHPENFREHDVGAIIASIERWGVWRPLVAQTSTRHVLVGNGELKAIRAMGYTDRAPVRWIDVDDDNARAILLADNWIPSRGRNMPGELVDLMAQLREERELFEATGADEDDLEDLERELADLEKPLKLDSRKMVRKTKITCPECGHAWEVSK